MIAPQLLQYFFATFAVKSFLLGGREEKKALNRKVRKENIAKFAKNFLLKELLVRQRMTS